MYFLQIVSDLHISELKRNIEECFVIPENAKENCILLLAGDITVIGDKNYRNVEDENYTSGIEGIIDWCSDRYMLTVYVPGNHEFIKGHVDNVLYELHTLNNRRTNFIFLYNEVIKLFDDYWLIGCTLWTNVLFANHRLISSITNSMIYNWNVEEHNREHACAVSFLNRTLQDTSKKWIVVSHHAPSILNTSNFFFSSDASNCAYSSDLDRLVKKTKYWFFGHTHWNITHYYPMSDTYLISNCQGKFRENTGRDYQKKLLIEL